MPKQQKGLVMAGIFLAGLLIGLTLGSYTPAVPKNHAAKTAEGAEMPVERLSGGLSSMDEQEVVYQGYLGVYNDRIAIYDGMPPTGVLRHVMTDFEVRDDVRPQLEQGILFTDTYDLLRLLENYSS